MRKIKECLGIIAMSYSALIISRKEVEKRRNKITRLMEKQGIDALFLASAANVAYVSNFFYLPTERPIVAVMNQDGTVTLITPLLEHEHAEKYSYADRVLYYPEYPDEKHPMKYIAEYMEEMGLADKVIGYDSDGWGPVFGYRGPKLSELLRSAKMVYARDIVEELRIKKSEEEIRLLAESAKWASLAHRLLQEYTRPGLYEDEISMLASMEATLAMARALKGVYRPAGWTAGAHAGFRGQVGSHSYYPHSLTIHAVIKHGDVLVTGATALISGYGAELERTMIVGEPSPNQEKYFKLMLRAREIAFEKIRPGTKCSEVDKAVRKFYKENGLTEYWRHHTGHGIGLEYHEPPFLDIGYDRVLEPGMVITIEPGIYVKGVGGFRHSDTVVVTEDGYEVLTRYPDQLEDLIVGL